jgi:glycosyltransferase involved in cell wall biosynthesis
VDKKNEPFTFVSVNGYNAFKGYEFLLPAFDIVCDQHPDIHLRIVGEDFQTRGFQKLLNKCKNKNKISFAGEVGKEQVREELWKADAFVIASRTEAQSVSTVEAMSAGLPVVGTSVTPEEILPKECGYIVPVENIPALADGLIRMINNYDSFDSNTISNHIKGMVSKEVVTKQLLEVYNEVLKKS